MPQDTTTTKANGAEEDIVALEAAAQKRIDALMAKVDRAKPDSKALAELRSLVIDNDAVLDALGDVESYARNEVIRPIAGDRRSVSLGVKAKMAQIVCDLGYKEAPMLEKMLIKNVALCWTHYHDVLRRYMVVTSESIPLARADFWERKLDRAHVRYLRACDELAKVRKMLRPTQVNIGMNQINVAK